MQHWGGPVTKRQGRRDKGGRGQTVRSPTGPRRRPEGYCDQPDTRWRELGPGWWPVKSENSGCYVEGLGGKGVKDDSWFLA